MTTTLFNRYQIKLLFAILIALAIILIPAAASADGEPTEAPAQSGAEDTGTADTGGSGESATSGTHDSGSAASGGNSHPSSDSTGSGGSSSPHDSGGSSRTAELKNSVTSPGDSGGSPAGSSSPKSSGSKSSSPSTGESASSSGTADSSGGAPNGSDSPNQQDQSRSPDPGEPGEESDLTPGENSGTPDTTGGSSSAGSSNSLADGHLSTYNETPVSGDHFFPAGTTPASTPSSDQTGGNNNTADGSEPCEALEGEPSISGIVSEANKNDPYTAESDHDYNDAGNPADKSAEAFNAGPAQETGNPSAFENAPCEETNLEAETARAGGEAAGSNNDALDDAANDLAASKGNSHLVTITPKDLVDGEHTGKIIFFEITFTEVGSDTLGSASIEVPWDFDYVDGSAHIVSSSGKSWLFEAIDRYRNRWITQINIWAETEDDYILHGESVSVGFSARMPAAGSRGRYEVETRAWLEKPSSFTDSEIYFQEPYNNKVFGSDYYVNIASPPAETTDPLYAWHTFYGSTGADTTSGIALDSEGNIYVTGMSQNSWNGPDEDSNKPLNAHSGSPQDLFVLKLDKDGSYQWHTFYGSMEDDLSRGIAIDGCNNVYVTGSSKTGWNGPDGDVNKPLNAHSGSPQDLFVLKLDKDGSYQWHTFYGSEEYDSSSGIAIDHENNVLIAGSSHGAWDDNVLTVPLNHYSGGSINAVVLKLDSAGKYVYHTFYGPETGVARANAIAVNSEGHVLVTGESNASWAGPGDVSPLNAYKGIADAFVLKLDNSGDYLWHTFYGSEAIDRGNAITVDSEGHIYLTGTSEIGWRGPGSQFPRNAHTNYYTWGRYGPQYNNDIFALKLDKDGNYQWHTFYGNNSSDIPGGIALDASGNVYIAGFSAVGWNGPLRQPPLNAHSDGYKYAPFFGDIVVTSLSSDGVYNWHSFYGAVSPDRSTAVAVTGEGSVYLVGISVSGWVGPGGQDPLQKHSNNDPFDSAFSDIVVLRLRPSPTVSTLGASGIEDHAARLNMIYTVGSHSPVEICFAYRAAGEESWAETEWIVKSENGKHSHDLVGLAIDTEYQVMALLRYDDSGPVDIKGAVHTFTTGTQIDPVYQWHTAGIAGMAIALDPDGNIYVSGQSEMSWDGPEGQNPLNSHSDGIQDVFILKMNSEGSYMWHTFYGSPLYDVNRGLAVDSSGSIYATGISRGPWTGPGDPPAEPLNAYNSGFDPGIGNRNIFALKLDRDGNYQWHTFYGPADLSIENSLAVDSEGNVYLTGYSNKSWHGPQNEAPLNPHSEEDEDPLPPLTYHAYTNNLDVFILKLSGEGAYRWHTFYGGQDNDYGYSITVDPFDYIYVTGYSYSPCWNGPGDEEPRNSPSGYIANARDLFVIKLDSDGKYQWHTFCSSGVGNGRAIDTDPAGNVYVAGYLGSFGPGNAEPKNPWGHMSVLKLDGDGEYQWHTNFGKKDEWFNAWTRDLAVDSAGNVYITGNSQFAWDGPGETPPLNPALHDWSMYIYSIDRQGNYNWHAFYGFGVGTGIAVDGSGYIYATGSVGDLYVPGDITPLPGHLPFVLKIGRPLPTVFTAPATGVDNESATFNLGYSVGAFSPVQARFAYRKTSENGYSFTDWVFSETDGALKETVVGLEQGAEYWFKAQLRYGQDWENLIEGQEQAVTISFTPSAQRYEIEANVLPSGGGDIEGKGPYDYGEWVKLEAIAKTGYHFSNWIEGGFIVSLETQVSFSAESDRFLIAMFSRDEEEPVEPPGNGDDPDPEASGPGPEFTPLFFGAITIGDAPLWSPRRVRPAERLTPPLIVEPETPLVSPGQYLALPPADPETDPAPLVTALFVSAGTADELNAVLDAYQFLYQQFEADWEAMSDEEYALALLDLATAWAAIQAREAALAAEAGEEADLEAAVEAYEAALDYLAEYGEFLSEEQLDALEEVLAAVAELLAALGAELPEA